MLPKKTQLINRFRPVEFSGMVPNRLINCVFGAGLGGAGWACGLGVRCGAGPGVEGGRRARAGMWRGVVRGEGRASGGRQPRVVASWRDRVATKAAGSANSPPSASSAIP